MTVTAIIDRLDRVRQTGPDRWIARCPAHEDRTPSLSVREIDDHVLVYCHAGCGAADVVHAVGLTLADLFERPLDHHVRPSRSRIPAADLLAVIDREALVVAVIGADVLKHREIDEPTWRRLSAAVSRIGHARGLSPA